MLNGRPDRAAPARRHCPRDHAAALPRLEGKISLGRRSNETGARESSGGSRRLPSTPARFRRVPRTTPPCRGSHRGSCTGLSPGLTGAALRDRRNRVSMPGRVRPESTKFLHRFRSSGGRQNIGCSPGEPPRVPQGSHGGPGRLVRICRRLVASAFMGRAASRGRRPGSTGLSPPAATRLPSGGAWQSP